MSFTTLIDAAALQDVLRGASPDGSRSVLLDCRFDLAAPRAGRQAYLREHIPGARYADLNEDLAGAVTPGSGRHPLPAPEALAQRLAALGVEPGVQVVAYDEANGSFAARAWWLLRWLGHPQVAVLDGGFKAWREAGGGFECGELKFGELTGPSVAAPATTPRWAASNAAGVASAADVQRGLSEGSHRLIDARAPERYAGIVEPIDPVAGHVPGAVNHPFADNLGPDGHFLAPTELRRRWCESLAGTSPANTILMCGSGVTACHDLLALEVAGLPGARLYAGSWSQWIQDSNRPVKRGTAP